MVVLMFAEWDWTSPELPVHNWWFFGVVLVLLIISIWVVALLTTSTSDDIDPAEIDRQMLSAVNELRSQGELTQEEYRSIKSRLVDRLSEQTPSADSNDSVHQGQQPQQHEGKPHSTTDTSDETEYTAKDDVEDTTHPSQHSRDEDKNA